MICYSWLMVFQNWDHRFNIFSVLFIILYSTVKSAVWHWNFRLFFFLNFNMVELLQDKLLTSCLVKLLLDNLSIGYKAREHQFANWNWSQLMQKLITKNVRIRLEDFYNGKWLRIVFFSISVFPNILIFPCISSKKESSNFLP